MIWFICFSTLTKEKDKTEMITYSLEVLNRYNRNILTKLQCEKPNGRADKVYMYTEFERSLTFNFKKYQVLE